MLDTTETLADRLNLEPVIFRGSSSSELSMILMIATVFWLPVSIVIASLLGAVAMGLGMSALGVLASVVIGSTLFQRIKRDRPDYYYQHLFLIQRQRFGFLNNGFIRRSGVWDLGRTR